MSYSFGLRAEIRFIKSPITIAEAPPSIANHPIHTAVRASASATSCDIASRAVAAKIAIPAPPLATMNPRVINLRPPARAFAFLDPRRIIGLPVLRSTVSYLNGFAFPQIVRVSQLIKEAPTPPPAAPSSFPPPSTFNLSSRLAATPPTEPIPRST
jgi:hypothetical protein